jgi:hypothetical protein
MDDRGDMRMRAIAELALAMETDGTSNKPFKPHS